MRRRRGETKEKTFLPHMALLMRELMVSRIQPHWERSQGVWELDGGSEGLRDPRFGIRDSGSEIESL